MPTDVEILSENAETDTGSADTGAAGAAAALEPGAARSPEAGGVQPPASPAAQEPSLPASGEAGAEAAATASPTIEIEYPEEPEEEVAVAEADAGQQSEPQPGSATARYGTAALGRILRENVELARVADATPRVKAQLYQMARRSQELAEYQEVMPSLARAKEALEAQQALGGYDQAYYGDTPETFWSTLHGASGTTGAYERNVQFLHQAFLDQLQQSGNEGLASAALAIREALGWGSSRHAHSQAKDGLSRGSDGELPPHIRQRLEQAERSARELEHLRSRLSEGERQAEEQFLDETAREAGRELRGFVDGLLASTGFSDYDKQNIARDFLERVAELGDQDRVHTAVLEEILHRGGMTPRVRAEMVARIKQWGRQNGREILEPILKQVGAGLKQRQAQREAARASRHAEPASAGAAPAPLRPGARDLVQQAEQRLGRRLSDREILELA